MQHSRNINFNFVQLKKCLYIFPMLSIAGLFLLGIITIIGPGFNNSVYADEPDESFAGSGDDGFNVSESDANADISPLAATAVLTIGGDAVNKQVTVAPGEVGYREHTVSVNVSDVTAYTLTISGPTNLTGPTGATTIGGAGGKAGNSMTDNTWGYGWGDTTTAKESLSYQTLSSSGTNLTVPAVSNYAAKFTKKLAFAAKFGSTNTNTGQYKANVTLSLVATPATVSYTITYNTNGGSGGPGTQVCRVEGTTAGIDCTTSINSTIPTRSNYIFQYWSTTSDDTGTRYAVGASTTITANTTLYAIWYPYTPGFSSITNMQQMTPTICANAKVGDYKDLIDTRDNNTYRVVKFKDNRCWMTENLKIYNRTINAADSDFTTPSSITLPSSALTDFANTNASKYSYQSYYNTSTTTGAGVNTTVYYNWYTATAGAGDSSISANSTVVDASICPKGWTLPTGGTATTTDFEEFASKESISSSSDGSTKIQAAPYNFKYTGAVYNGSLYYGSGAGYWWSSTANSANGAYYRYIDRSGVNPGTYDYSRPYGYAVRCIARN